MNTRVTSWQVSNVPGPKLGRAVTPDVAARIIDKAENPLLVVGANITELDSLLELVIRLSKTGITLTATSNSVKHFRERKVDVEALGLSELTNLLRDEEWKGFNGKGNYDLVIFLGIEYWLLSQMANTLKNFTDIETLTLTRYYQPNATFSFPNLSDDIWIEYLNKVCKKLES
ncbi:MAG: CO dehydrogenase/acetyl-CoA synthase complex subunit epsilon [Candidatus Hydrothermarchaeales archaeon]